MIRENLDIMADEIFINSVDMDICHMTEEEKAQGKETIRKALEKVLEQSATDSDMSALIWSLFHLFA